MEQDHSENSSVGHNSKRNELTEAKWELARVIGRSIAKDILNASTLAANPDHQKGFELKDSGISRNHPKQEQANGIATSSGTAQMD